MKIYGIAAREHHVAGHGDSYDSYDITPLDKNGINAYGIGEYQFFKSMESAKKYLNSLQWNSDKIIVEIEVKD